MPDKHMHDRSFVGGPCGIVLCISLWCSLNDKLSRRVSWQNAVTHHSFLLWTRSWRSSPENRMLLQCCRNGSWFICQEYWIRKNYLQDFIEVLWNCLNHWKYTLIISRSGRRKTNHTSNWHTIMCKINFCFITIILFDYYKEPNSKLILLLLIKLLLNCSFRIIIINSRLHQT